MNTARIMDFHRPPLASLAIFAGDGFRSPSGGKPRRIGEHVAPAISSAPSSRFLSVLSVGKHSPRLFIRAIRIIRSGNGCFPPVPLCALCALCGERIDKLSRLHPGRQPGGLGETALPQTHTLHAFPQVGRSGPERHSGQRIQPPLASPPERNAALTPASAFPTVSTNEVNDVNG